VSENEGKDAEASNEADEADLLAPHKELLERLREKHEEIAIFPAPKKFGGIIVIAPPLNHKSYQDYVNNLHNDKADKSVEATKFLLACTFHPDPQTAKEIYKHRPGLVTPLVNRAADLSGAGVTELGKG
jgi:hypothetical protein